MLSLLLFVATRSSKNNNNNNHHFVSATDDASSSLFECSGICGNNVEGTADVLNNPDTVVTYSWNDNVPVGSSTVGVTEQTLSCGQFDLTLYSFSPDPSACTKHQTGLQSAGCVCGDGSGSGSSSRRTSTGLALTAFLAGAVAVGSSILVML
jgi:hypothetical protein